MKAVRGSGNQSTELALARVLRTAGFSGWRRHLPYPGHPDFCWPSYKVAVFVDGCFWHGCPRCYSTPKSNRAFWRAKVVANKLRDRRVSAQLRGSGWTVVRIWECRVHSPGTLNRIHSALNSPRA